MRTSTTSRITLELLLDQTSILDSQIEPALAAASPALILELAVERIRDLRSDRFRQTRLNAERAAEPHIRSTPYRSPAQRQEAQEATQASDALLMVTLKSIIGDYAAQLRLEWTDELLATSFALPDGTHVTWGSATIADHQLRYEMFAQQAETSTEGAARHLHAVNALEAAERTCLNSLVSETCPDCNGKGHHNFATCIRCAHRS